MTGPPKLDGGEMDEEGFTRVDVKRMAMLEREQQRWGAAVRTVPFSFVPERT